MCIYACEQSTEQLLLMGFLPYNHLLWYDTDFLNVMHVSKYSGGRAPSDTPAHTSCRYNTHSHFLLHSSSGFCQSRWHGDPSNTQSGRTGWPPTR